MEYRFQVFDCFLFVMRNINYSWTPYYYDIKCGPRKRVISVILRNCSRTRVCLHCVATILLLVASLQQYYNGFLVYKHLAIDKDQPWETAMKTNKTVHNDNEVQSLWDIIFVLIVKLFTFNHFYGAGEHSRRINMVGYSFTIQALLRRLYFSFRKQRRRVRRQIIRTDSSYLINRNSDEQPETVSKTRYITSNRSDIYPYSNTLMRYIDFVSRPKLTFHEYIRYCILRQSIDNQLLERYPILRDLSDKELLQIDLMNVLQENSIVCTAQVIRSVYAIVLIIFLSILFGSLFSITGVKFLVYYFDNMHLTTITNSSYELLKYAIIVIYFTTANWSFVDSWYCYVLCRILIDRLTTFDRQLEQFIESCRTWDIQEKTMSLGSVEGKATKWFNSAINHLSETHWEPTRKNQLFCNNRHVVNGKPQESQLVNNYHDKNHYSLNRIVGYRSVLQIIKEKSHMDIREATWLDTACQKHIIVLHQLIFEFKQIKLDFEGDLHLDLVCAFTSVAWYTKMIVETYQCYDCTQIPIVNCITGLLSLAYFLDIMIKMIGMAPITRKVNYKIGFTKVQIYQ